MGKRIKIRTRPVGERFKADGVEYVVMEAVDVKKKRIVFEVEERPTNCCECAFGGTCPYACAFSGKLDCAKYNLGTLRLVEIKDVED